MQAKLKLEITAYEYFNLQHNFLNTKNSVKYKKKLKILVVSKVLYSLRTVRITQRKCGGKAECEGFTVS